MKQITYIVIACTIVLLGSCELDYSEGTVYSKEEMFAMRAKGIDRMVWGIYGQLDYDAGDKYTNGAMMASATDEADCPWEGSTIHQFYNGAWSALCPNTNAWGHYYTAIRQANLFLNEAADLTFEEYKYNKDYADYMKKYSRYKYEVRFLRAYFYFSLVKHYGDIPLVLTLLSEKEANQVYRTPVTKIFEFIVSECDEIASYLPTDYTSETFQETGRATKQMALALKARATLYAASPLFNKLNDPQLWINAADANLEAIEACKKAGANIGTYASLWGSENYLNKEVLLAIRQSEGNQFERYNYPMGVEGGKSGNCPTQTLVDAYELKTTGKIWSESGDAYNPSEPYNDLDPRFEMTIAKNGDIWPAYNEIPLQTYSRGLNGQPNLGATTTGYYLKKFCDNGVDLRPNSTTSKRHSFIIFRMGELYINYAEAIWHVLGNADVKTDKYNLSANEAVNVLRTRSDVDMPLFEGSAGFMERLRRERMVELAFEGHRFWDVRRWKLGKEHFSSIEVMNIVNQNGKLSYQRNTKKRYWDDKMYFFPIPESELNLNKNLTQNIGW